MRSEISCKNQNLVRNRYTRFWIIINSIHPYLHGDASRYLVGKDGDNKYPLNTQVTPLTITVNITLEGLVLDSVCLVRVSWF